MCSILSEDEKRHKGTTHGEQIFKINKMQHDFSVTFKFSNIQRRQSEQQILKKNNEVEWHSGERL